MAGPGPGVAWPTQKGTPWLGGGKLFCIYFCLFVSFYFVLACFIEENKREKGHEDEWIGR